ncbi:hypothetical protein GCM10011359_30770 [Nesterenkonia alkaliphila]|nr:hypothetical protein GCM10011359_30770 [Nesterenkonia alkaliphila]
MIATQILYGPISPINTPSTSVVLVVSMRVMGMKANTMLVMKHTVDTPGMVAVIVAIMWVSSGGCFGSCWFWVCRWWV